MGNGSLSYVVTNHAKVVAFLVVSKITTSDRRLSDRDRRLAVKASDQPLRR